jgi:tetratricopeptide (TPR) repeat protein
MQLDSFSVGPRMARFALPALACLVFVPLLLAGVARATEPEAAPAPPVRPVIVFPSHVDAPLEAVAEGYAEFVRLQLTRVAIDVVPGSDTRRTMAMAPGEPGETATADQLARAGRSDAHIALLLDLRERRGVVELDLRAYLLAGPNAGQLVGGALGMGTLATLAPTTNPVLLQVLPALGPNAQMQPPSEGLPGPDQLAAASRALALIDAHSLTAAWQELEGFESPFLSGLRAQIDRAKKRPGLSLAEHARLLIAQGRVHEGWRLVFDQAQDAISSGTADGPLLLAAGEAQLAQGNARGASKYLEKSVALAPDSPASAISLARAYEASHRMDDARSQYERAAELAPTQVKPLEELAALPSSTPSEQADYLFEAGKRASHNLQTKDAGVNLQRAVRLNPSLAPLASEANGALHARVGQHTESLAAYRQAIDEDEPTPARLRGVARAQRALRDVNAAKATNLEVLKLDGSDVGALRDLGEIYSETGEPEMAIVRLERAQDLAPSSVAVQRSLARALRERAQPGDLERARQLHLSANTSSEPTERDLRELASVQQDLGDVDGAVATLERTLLKRHLSMYTRTALAEAYRARGDEQAAEAVLSVVRLVSGDAGGSSEPATGESPEEEIRFDALLDSFSGPGSAGQRVAFLGLRSGTNWRDIAVDWLHPHAPNKAAIEVGILAGINRSHLLVGVPVGAMDAIGASGSDLFRFDTDVSRSAELITFTNLSVDTDAVFLGRVLHPMGSMGAVAACGSDPYYVLELRKLGGQSDTAVSVLANRACVAAGIEDGYSVWNAKASVGWILLVLLLLRPALRGWGRVRVLVRAPQHGRALFSISISRRPKKFKADKKDSSAPGWRFEKRLQSVRGSERRLKGNVMTFGIVPARRKHYYITVRGPLLDLGTDKVIGEFLEEKTIRVRPWRTNEIKFDMRTETAAITVKPKLAGVEDLAARVSLRGNPQSLRFLSGGEAYLYASPGRHVIVVGAEDRVAEQAIEIGSPAPVTLHVDLDEPEGLVFRGCPKAVTPYVEGDYPAAAEALMAAGENVAAERVRALHLRRSGDTEGAARVLEGAGMHAESVELQRDEAPTGAAGLSPELLEKAGDFRQAGEAYEAACDYAAAARNYEQAYDYQRAADCYGEIGDSEKVVCMLEALGDVYEAGKTAAEAGLVDRAISNLQQVDSRHGFYSERCRLLAELLTQRGELDLAVATYAEALGIWGTDSAPLEMQQAYGELLEQAERQQEALTVYEGIRRRDVHFSDVTSRIETLKKHLSTVTEQASDTATMPVVVGATKNAQVGDENSRYEIIEELGRGGMGVVYRARDRNLGRVVALKVLPDNLRQHPHAVKLFLREARAAAALNHQNIVTLFDAGQEGDAYFITMECLEGGGLETVLASRGSLPTKAVATVGLQVSAGLDYAQRARIVHRDIKPSNLFLTRDRTVKIMDFGLAKVVEEVRRGSTVIGGTPNFMAPEQATGGDVDHRTDLYALGGTLFELVTGTVPYESGDMVYHHVHTPPPDARERNVEVPAGMAELLMQMMAKDPNDRVQSARDLATRLQAILKTA